jgi:E3 ubiquitin-protein ligase HUWE1
VDVLFETIKFLTRPAVRFSSQKSLKITFGLIQGVLQVLADRWVSGNVVYDLLNCYHSTEQQKPKVTFQFYRSLDDEKNNDNPADRKSSIDFNAPVVICQEPPFGSSEKDAFLLWKQIVTDFQVPVAHSYELLHKSRWCTINDVNLRKKLLCIRLLSISILTNMYNEDLMNKKIFLFEPDLISKLSQLLVLDFAEFPNIHFAALSLLDSLSHYRGKLNEVMATVGASANHGYLISMLRKIIETFEKNGNYI